MPERIVEHVSWHTEPVHNPLWPNIYSLVYLWIQGAFFVAASRHRLGQSADISCVTAAPRKLAVCNTQEEAFTLA